MFVTQPAEHVCEEIVHFFSGPHRLEGVLAYPDDIAPLGAVVLAGPHPLLGGAMNNNVLRGLGEGLAQKGLLTLRFNYRGVGGSEGPAVAATASLAKFWSTSRTDDEHAYHQDYRNALACLCFLAPASLHRAVIGYSFGCTLLAETVADDEVPQVLIAPTIGRHDYSNFTRVHAPKLVIVPEEDFASSTGDIRKWFELLPEPRQLVEARLDGHFFRGYEGWLVETVCDFLLDAWRVTP